MSNYYAQLNAGGIVTGLQVSHTPINAESVIAITEQQYRAAKILGMQYENGTFTAVETVHRIITKEAFLARINFAAKVYLKSVDDATYSVFVDELSYLALRDPVNLDKDVVVGGCMMIEQLTQGQDFAVKSAVLRRDGTDQEAWL